MSTGSSSRHSSSAHSSRVDEATAHSVDVEGGNGTSILTQASADEDDIDAKITALGHEDGRLASHASARNVFRFGSVRMPVAMETFLFQALDDKGQADGRGSDHTSEGEEFDSIFETEFDVTEERLRRLFTMFDMDQDGKISYANLRKGLEYHTTTFESHLDEASFEQLVNHLDMDKSGDITFEEFSEGIRLMMLRSLFRKVVIAKSDDSVVTEVFDYNARRLERSIVEGFGQQGDVRTSCSVLPMSVQEFFFVGRPDWIAVRWINITGASIDVRGVAVESCEGMSSDGANEAFALSLTFS
jgi:EF-hand domain pair